MSKVKQTIAQRNVIRRTMRNLNIRDPNTTLKPLRGRNLKVFIDSRLHDSLSFRVAPNGGISRRVLMFGTCGHCEEHGFQSDEKPYWLDDTE